MIGRVFYNNFDGFVLNLQTSASLKLVNCLQLKTLDANCKIYLTRPFGYLKKSCKHNYLPLQVLSSPKRKWGCKGGAREARAATLFLGHESISVARLTVIFETVQERIKGTEKACPIHTLFDR